MSVNSLKARKSWSLAVLLLVAHASYVLAQQNESLLNFKFNHSSNVQRINTNSQSYPSLNVEAVVFSQFDATWTYRTYPSETKNVNIDLGVTLRHLSGFNHSISNQRFQEVLPLVHASALFALPLKGLSAGIEGSHLDSNNKQIFDFRAKVSYEWRKGFGLQSGWQHQQFNLNDSVDTGYEKNGPYIDFYLNF